MSFKEYLKEEKIPDNISLGFMASKHDIRPIDTTRATIMGGIKSMEYFKKNNVPHLISGSYDVKIIDGEMVAKLTRQGKKTIRVRSKTIPNYLKDVTKVLKATYVDYFRYFPK